MWTHETRVTEPLIEGDFTTGKLTRTDIEFLLAGLALSGVSRVSLPLLTSVLALDIIAALMNWYNWPKLQDSSHMGYRPDQNTDRR